MGVQSPSTEPQGPRRSGRKRQISSISTGGGGGSESSDSVQITKVRKTGQPSFSERSNAATAAAAAPAAAPTKPPTKSRKPATAPNTQGKKKRTTYSASPEPVKRKKKAPSSTTEEKRPKRYRDHPPQNVAERLDRAKHQRMYVLSRSGQQGLSETFTMAGSTGNVYTVRIDRVPSCNCPDGQKNGTCKHILYVMDKALKAPQHLVYQAGLLTCELEEIFAKAPRGDTAKAAGQKPLDADDCPICFCAFEQGEQVVWCKAQCGSNIHTACFAQWKKTKGPDDVTCVMCREPWQEGETEKVADVLKNGKGKVVEGGYVNVADELGMSGVRDYSSYNPWFTGAAQYGFGWQRRGY